MTKREKVLLLGMGMPLESPSLAGRATLGYVDALRCLGYEVAVLDDLPHPVLAGITSRDVALYIEPLSPVIISRLMQVTGSRHLLWELREGHFPALCMSQVALDSGDPFRQHERWRTALGMKRLLPHSLGGGTGAGWVAVASDGEGTRILAAVLPGARLPGPVRRRVLEATRALGWPGVWEMDVEICGGNDLAFMDIRPHPFRVLALAGRLAGVNPVELHLCLLLGRKGWAEGLEETWVGEPMQAQPVGEGETEGVEPRWEGLPTLQSYCLQPGEASVMLKAGCITHQGEQRLVLWEELEESGFLEGRGLAVAPPCHLGRRMAGEVLHRVAEEARRHRGFTVIRLLLGRGRARLAGVEGGSSQWPFAFWVEKLFGSARILKEGVFPADYPCHFPGGGPYLARIPTAGGGGSDEGTLEDKGKDRQPWGYRLALGKSLEEVLVRAVLERLGGFPRGGKVVLSVADREKREVIGLARELALMGYEIFATEGTARALKMAGIEAKKVKKLKEGRPNILHLLRGGGVDMVVNVPRGRGPQSDGRYIREEAAAAGIPCFTRVHSAWYLVRGMRSLDLGKWDPWPVGLLGGEGHEFSTQAG
jgi:hypothetical protein